MPKAPPLDRQTVLLTGAAAGLGRALALAFDRAGARLVLVDVNREALDETAAMLAQTPDLRVCDLSGQSATADLADAIRKAHPRIDTLIHNAGYLKPTPYADTDARLWDTTFNTGLPAAHLLTHPFWAGWQQTGAAAIYVSSRAGIEGGAGHAPYVATKHAIEGFVKVLGEEGAPAGIMVHAITPGAYMRTPMSEQNHPPDVRPQWIDPILLAPAFLYLAQRPDAALSGQRLNAWDLSEAQRHRFT
jgi:NAD(P)-dependent dehydrogenase (short-subunit alcohol dehydrogenase family)